MLGGARGVEVEHTRGYSIRSWSGPDVEIGHTKPFSAQPMHGFSRKAFFDTIEEARAWIAKAPPLKVLSITFEAYLPLVGATEEQIEEWVKFELDYNGSIGRNPLMDESLDAFLVQVEVVDVT